MKSFIFYNLCNMPIYFSLLIFLGYVYVTNPIDYVLSITGHTAIIFLIILALIPHIFFRLGVNFLAHRRSIGLYVFIYSLLHTLIYFALDYQLQWSLVLQEIKLHLYLQLGLLALVCLLPMVLTSNDYAKKILTVWWYRIHKLIYLAILFSIAHYYFLIKLDYNFLIIYTIIFLALFLLPKKNAQ